MSHARRATDDLAAEVTLRAGFVTETQCRAARETFLGAGSFVEHLEQQALLTPAQAAAVRALVDAWPPERETGDTSGETAMSATLTSQDPTTDVTDEVLLELVEGRYEFRLGPDGHVQELGRGGLGRVLAARDAATGRVVAVKELLPVRGSAEVTARLDARFLREARVAAQLEHPAIVPVYEIGRRADGTLYYTMRRIRGRTLAAAIAQQPRLDERLRLVRHLHTLAQALAYAHERGVVHRDVKPANVMLGPFGETWLLDWGLARRLDAPGADQVTAVDLSAGLAPAAAGTPSYMSPELARGVADARTDVFCLGGVLFELLARQPPRRAATAVEAVHLARTTPIPPVRTVAPDAPAELASICDRAMAFEPGQRYPSAAALAADLAAWLEGRRVGAYEYAAGELLRRFAKKHRAVLAVAAAALLALVTVLAVAGVRVRREADASRQFAQLLLDDVSSKLARAPGSLPLLREVTNRATAHFAREGRLEALGEADRTVLVGAWLRLARLQLELGDLEGYPDTSALIARLVPPVKSPFDPRVPLAVEAVDILVLDGSAAWLRGDSEQALALLTRGARAVDEALAAGAAPMRWLDLKHRAHRPLGRLVEETGTTLEVLAHHRAAIDALERLQRDHAVPPDEFYVESLLDLAVRLQEVDGAGAIAIGERAVAVAEALPQLSTDTNAAGAAGTAHRQLAAILRAERRVEDARPHEREARTWFELALRLEPTSIVAITEMGDLAFQAGEFSRAVEFYRRSEAQGLGNDLLSGLMAAELFSGNPGAVIALRPRTRAEDFEQQLFLGLAYVAAGRTAEGLEVLGRLDQLELGTLQYPQGAVPALGQRLGGPVGQELERLGLELDAAARGDDASAARFTQVARSFAPRLRAAAGKAGAP